tara:strand:- start:14580 stop:15185 length:606 start_codon:yes stop_codon:yes gene_type:complete
MDNPELEHFFLIEDDIISCIRKVNPFERYIDTSRETGIQHLMYGYHGPANKTGSKGTASPRLVVKYKGDTAIALNQHCVGAFCYYSRKCLEDVGLLDETFFQAFDHVEHSYRIVKAGMCPAYWWWPDVAYSYWFLDEIACSEDSSSIRFKDDKEWHENIKRGAEHFKDVHGFLPAWNGCVPDTAENTIYNTLKMIKHRWEE